jgi:hypothetical protein
MNGVTKTVAMLTISLSANLFAQNWYPLSAGNAWRYSVTYLSQNPWTTSFYTVRVVGDTLMPNGKRYWILDPGDIFGARFVRSDTSHVYYWQRLSSDTVWKEIRAFHLRISPGTTDTLGWATYWYATDQGQFGATIFDRNVICRSFSLSGLLFGNVSLADGFGYVSFADNADLGPAHKLWLLIGCIVSDTIYGTMVEVLEQPLLPRKSELFQNYPNPFNPSTTIRFSIPERSRVRVTIFNLLGQQVVELANEEMNTGNFERVWNSNVASGLYFYRIEAISITNPNKRFVDVKKMVLLR